jgi:PAT family beta-lactamase induction signal transducer AmpG
MALDNFGIAMAGVTLVAYMSSLTSLGYTATQYALLSSTYAWAGKILKGFSGAAVEAMSARVGLINAYALFFIGCGAIGLPALILFALLGRNQRRQGDLAINRA